MPSAKKLILTLQSEFENLKYHKSGTRRHESGTRIKEKARTQTMFRTNFFLLQQNTAFEKNLLSRYESFFFFKLYQLFKF